MTPNSGFLVNVAEITFHCQRSGTGPTSWLLRSNIDNFTTNIAANSLAIPTVFAAIPQTSGTLSANSAIQGVVSGITFRLYGATASGTSGTFRVDNLTVLGTIVTQTSNPLISVSAINLGTFSTIVGTPSATKSFNVSGLNLTDNVVISAPTGYEISLSSASGFASTLTLNQSVGVVNNTPVYVRLTGAITGSFSGNIVHVSNGATTQNVIVTGAVNSIVPTIIVSTSALNAFVTTTGTPSLSQSYTIAANSLSADVLITPPAGYEISLTSSSGFAPSLTLLQSSGNVTTTTIYLRLTGAMQGSYSGNVTHSSIGAVTQNVTLTGMVNAPFNGQNYVHLRGNFHAHTTYSDGNKDAATSGVSSPGGSFAYARLSNNMDFLGISEHNHVSAGMALSSYALGVSQAVAETTPTFSALYGIEYGVINNGGHMLVYGFDKLIGWDAGQYDIFNSQYDYTSLYNIINARTGAWASLAHPQSGDYTNLLSSQAYNSSANDAVAGCAIRSGSAFSTTTNYSDSPASLYEQQYQLSLAKGYHLGPFIDHDNHNTTFGRTVKGRTVVLAEANTPVKILEAVKARRVYASDDWNEKIDFTISGLNIGSIGNVAGNPFISVTVSDPDNENAVNIELWYGVPGSNSIATLLTSATNNNILTYTHSTVQNSTYYYYVKVTQADGDLLWSAPIWPTKISNTLPIDLLNFDAKLNEKGKAVVTWKVEQSGSANYAVERSPNGTNFDNISEIRGSVNGGTHNYSFTDNKPIEGYSYYRIKQIDEDGSFKYSNIVSIFFKPIFLKLLNISPNPTPDVINIAFDSEKLHSDFSCFVYDTEGRAVLYQKIVVTEGGNNLLIDVSKLPAGLYYLNIGKRDERMIETRFMKF